MNKNFRYSLIMLVSLFAASANAEQWAHSVNSDSQSNDMDSLYWIDLENGGDQLRGPLDSGDVYNHYDTEGLAFAPNNTLWGIDDGSQSGYLILYPINTYGSVNFNNVISLTGLPTNGSNDFGMTFSCDGSLYVTSVNTKTLYSVDLADGSADIINAEAIGSLGVNISAIAASSDPPILYGLGNGQLEGGGVDSPNLYSIDISTGLATMIGPLGNLVDDYEEGGLAFDSDGDLWAITDRSKYGQPSQILQIDPATGIATPAGVTSETGFESLAIASPPACVTSSNDNNENEYTSIPTLNLTGRLLAILVLMFAGMTILRRRIY